jgi:hypothetical protein
MQGRASFVTLELTECSPGKSPTFHNVEVLLSDGDTARMFLGKEQDSSVLYAADTGDDGLVVTLKLDREVPGDQHLQIGMLARNHGTVVERQATSTLKESGHFPSQAELACTSGKPATSYKIKATIKVLETPTKPAPHGFDFTPGLFR